MTVPETYREKRGETWQVITKHTLQTGIDFDGKTVTPHIVAKWLRRERYMKPESRGRVIVNVFKTEIHILSTYNLEPLFIFLGEVG